ncbi:MAG: hypothetical protein JF599_04315 [Verrucomicrobia bacterium]|nr:hypothetical protein [Verrucomicrobiota bacterium]
MQAPLNLAGLLRHAWCKRAGLCVAFVVLPWMATAQTVTTVPVGAVTVTIAAGTGASRVASVVSFPLLDTPLASGSMGGSITSFTANSLSCSAANWTAGALSITATPYLVQITSGVAKGYIFLIATGATSPNTATTLTIASDEAGLVDLTAIGLITGDSFKIIPCDTLSSILGTPQTTGVVGGADSTQADIVQVLVGTTYRQYYYKTGTTNAWTRVGAETLSNDIPIRPDSLVIYNRIGNTPIAFQLTGTVPSVDRKAIVRNSGLTALSTGWPVNTTLSQLGINNLPNWATASNSSAVSSADIVQILVGTTYRQYYYNGTSWYRVGAETLSDGVVVAAGSGVIISRRGASTGAAPIAQALPYSL